MMVNMKRKGIFALFIMLSLANDIVTAQDVLEISVKVAGRKINAEAEPLSVSVFIIDFKLS